MSSLSDEFRTQYNNLDNLLRRITNERDNKNLISYYERILPQHLASQMETIRKYKNVITSHGVSVGGEFPEPPRTYITFLLDQISYVESHKELVKRKLLCLLIDKGLAKRSKCEIKAKRSSEKSECKTNTTKKSDLCTHFNPLSGRCESYAGSSYCYTASEKYFKLKNIRVNTKCDLCTHFNPLSGRCESYAGSSYCDKATEYYRKGNNVIRIKCHICTHFNPISGRCESYAGSSYCDKAAKLFKTKKFN